VSFILEQRSQRSALPAGFVAPGWIRENTQNNVHKRRRQIQLCHQLTVQDNSSPVQPVSKHIVPNPGSTQCYLPCQTGGAKGKELRVLGKELKDINP